MSLGDLTGVLDELVKGPPQCTPFHIFRVVLVRLLNHRPSPETQEPALFNLFDIDKSAQLLYRIR